MLQIKNIDFCNLLKHIMQEKVFSTIICKP